MTPASAAPSPPPSPDAGALLRPLEVGPVRLPNRIVFGAHLTNFGQGNVFTGRHRAYYAARAAGGTGLLVTEALTVHPLDWPYEHVPFGHTDAIVPSLEALAETVRAANPDTRLLAQLNHTGGQTSGKLLRQSPWAPSPVPDVASRRVPREMSPAEIEEVVAGFAAAAARVARAGLDGVEINAGQHALLRQFLSPLTNQRGDNYGGSLENRLRALLRVLAAVREALGPGRALGLKLCGDELAPWGGLTPGDAAEIARRIVAGAPPDYLSVQIGGPYSVHVTEAAMPTPQAHAAHLAQGVREAIGGAVPVLAEGRIESPAVAREVLAGGQADAVVMTRALVSDPDLPRKVAGADAEPVRPHIGMTRYFSVRGDWNRPLGDLANPRAGREALLPPVAPLEAPGPALVIGAGPAGLEAAVTLARQGRAVTLVERAPDIGGMAAVLAREVNVRAEFALLVDYYRAMLERLGVTVRLNTDAAAMQDSLDGYERVLLATGAEPPAPPFAGSGAPVLTPRDLLAGGADRAELPPPEAGRTVVVDGEYGFRMGNAVEWLLQRGYAVDVVSDDLFVGRELVESGELLWFNRVASQGARLHPRLRAEAWRDGALTCRDRFGTREQVFEGVALLVVAQPETPATALEAVWRAAHARVTTIGDARAPRLMGEAISHAHRAVLGE